MKKEPKNFNENKVVAQKGGNVAKAARLQLERTTGEKVVTKLNTKNLDKPMLNTSNDEE